MTSRFKWLFFMGPGTRSPYSNVQLERQMAFVELELQTGRYSVEEIEILKAIHATLRGHSNFLGWFMRRKPLCWYRYVRGYITYNLKYDVRHPLCFFGIHMRKEPQESGQGYYTDRWMEAQFIYNRCALCHRPLGELIKDLPTLEGLETDIEGERLYDARSTEAEANKIAWKLTAEGRKGVRVYPFQPSHGWYGDWGVVWRPEQ